MPANKQRPLEELFGEARFDEDATLTSARWRRLILSNEGRVSEANETGTSSKRAPTVTEFGDVKPMAPTGTESSPAGFSLQNETAKKKAPSQGLRSRQFCLQQPPPFR